LLYEFSWYLPIGAIWLVIGVFYIIRAGRSPDRQRLKMKGVAHVVGGTGIVILSLFVNKLDWRLGLAFALVLLAAVLSPRKETFDAISRRSKRSD
jgi:hypothetical protein